MDASTQQLTLAHVTHEAIEQVGGIGTVLHGLFTSPPYRQRIGRSILIGPATMPATASGQARLGEHGEVLYSSTDGIDRSGMVPLLQPIEQRFDVAVVYGKRRYEVSDQQDAVEVEVLLIDVHHINRQRLDVFKLRLWETFGLDSSRYEGAWDYEEYVRLAEPACDALQAILGDSEDPCVVFAHEFMGVPAALAAKMQGDPRVRTVFHAHECASARRVVEDHEGHDVMFYNVLEEARRRGLYVEDVFGSLGHQFRHALVSLAHQCDAVIAVGDRVCEELKFLNEQYDRRRIDLVYNGVPAGKVDPEAKRRSRMMLQQYAVRLGLDEPDVLMTHVTRPVISKGLWRDLSVCHELDRALETEHRRAVLFILTSAAGVRPPDAVRSMEEQYGWPRRHHDGYPDLVGPEVDIHNDIITFNAQHRAVQVVLVNQFGWNASRIGDRLPAGMDIIDLRRATDVEFGMATYEPFGISPLEPLSSGALCVISNVCGCRGFAWRANDGTEPRNIICADFTSLEQPLGLDELMAMTRKERDRIEHAVVANVASEILSRLPTTDQQRQSLMDSGQALAARMGWDRVIEADLIPLLDRISAESPRQAISP